VFLHRRLGVELGKVQVYQEANRGEGLFSAQLSIKYLFFVSTLAVAVAEVVVHSLHAIE